MRFNRIDNLLMTLAAGSLSDFAPVRRDLNVVREPAGGEVVRVPESVAGFGRVFTNKLGRRMTVVTDSYRPVDRLHPAGILLVHDVTIDASIRIIGHVRVTTRVDEGIGAYANSETKRDTQQYSWC